MKCEECGGELIYRVVGHTCCWECPQCGWGLASTFFTPIEVDRIEYTLTIQKTSEITLAMIKCAAKLMACNYIHAKAALENSSGTISGQAQLIKQATEKLSAVGLLYKIEPDFPY